MLTLARDRIAAVGHVIAHRRQEIRLASIRPAERGALEAPGLARVEQAHLLQEHQIGVQRLDTQAQVMDLQPLARPHPTNALVDVVSGHTQGAVAQVAAWREAGMEVRLHALKPPNCGR